MNEHYTNTNNPVDFPKSKKKINDQVRELLIEAGFKAPELAGRAIKLVELVVQECMKVAGPNYMSTPEDSVYYVEQAIDRIAEHFGVEE